MAFGEIYEAVVSRVKEVVDTYGPDTELTFDLSPGTSAMAAVWIILAKTRFPAVLLESSREHGVRVASVPFDISAEFIPDLLRKPDEALERLTAGLPPEAPEFDEILHRSPVMKRLIAMARRVAPRKIPVLIEGESGTGKELLARAIHRASTRRDRRLVAVNCGAIPEELVESQLFGHKKGSFTGATRDHIGFFEAAHQSTLFLDEVGELPLSAQVKLLRVLQEGEALPIGGDEPVKVDVRIITATNRSLADEVVQGTFREDLFYRLAVAVLRIPALRDRPGDLTLLIDRLLEQINQESDTEPGHRHKILSVNANNLLLAHNWQGNVRELQNTLRRMVVWSSNDTITADEVREAILPAPSHIKDKNNILDRPISDGIDLNGLISQVARHYLERAMVQTSGNKTQSAKLLGFSNYQTFTNWLKRYGVEN